MEIANRAVFRGQVTKLSKSASEYLSFSKNKVKEENIARFDDIEEELTVFLDRLTSARDNLNKANGNVRALISPEDCEKECEGAAEYDDKAVAVISRIKLRLGKIQNTRSVAMMPIPLQASSNDKPCAIRIPKLELRKFSGDSKDWLPFWEQFRTSIHENNNLSGSDKFNYLQSVLTGRAAASIAGFTPTQTCYNAAVALLREEYGDKEKIIDKNLQFLMALTPVTSRHDVIGLRRLYNSTITSTRTLTALGIAPLNYSIMLKAILLKCMPNELRIEFHRSQYSQDISTTEDEPTNNTETDSIKSNGSSLSFKGDEMVNGILKFLKKEVESLERSAGTKSPCVHSQESSKLYRTATNLLTANDDNCYFCKATTHSTHFCDGIHSVLERKDMLKREGICFKCTKRGHTSRQCRVKVIRCSKCHGKHATSMCDPEYHQNLRKSSSIDEPSHPQSIVNLCSPNSAQLPNIYLQTACAFISPTLTDRSPSLFVRIILDGGSQRTYIKQKVARKMNLEVIDTVSIRILPFGSCSSPPAQVYNRVKFVLRSQHDNCCVKVLAVEVPEICLDVLPVPNGRSPELSKYDLADTHKFGNLEGGISVLVGSDFYWKVVTGESDRINDSLVAVKTKLGWTIQGTSADTSIENESCLSAITLSASDDNFIREFCEKRFWDLETVGISKDTSYESVNTDINQYVKRKGDRYEASLLWCKSDACLDSYRNGALSRLDALVKKLKREPCKLFAYDTAINEFLSSGYAEKVNESTEDTRLYYMPHRAVYREDKTTTKLRIVFDASARSGTNLSLNDHLSAGPNLIPDILAVLLNFRARRIGLVADVEKAFLQILLAEEDRDVHRFIWFKERLNSIDNLPQYQEYRMTRVTFGVRCSPFLLAATLQKLLREYVGYPETLKLLQRAFYMDDLVLSVSTEEEAERIFIDTCDIMQKASMNLRKWNSNNGYMRSKCSKGCNEIPKSQKVLGIQWYCLTDEILIDFEQVEKFLTVVMTSGTKRNVLQLISRIFDPLGMLAPFIIKLKILFQETWRMKLTWDETLPNNLLKDWNNCCTDMHILRDISLPRCLIPFVRSVNHQIHLFADASVQAYGTVAYIRSVNENGAVNVQYLCSKNRVAPLKEDGNKELSLPKLELTAALIAARLGKYLVGRVNLNMDAVFFWSDSSIALHWISGDSRRWKPYVANRVNEIKELSNPTNWKHCPGDQNPADLLTRGVSGKRLIECNLFFQGPSWLLDEKSNWPSLDARIHNSTLLSCLEVSAVAPSHNLKIPLFDLERFSNYQHVLRITACIQRFTKKARGIFKHNNRFLVAEELKIAEMYWIRYTQEREYSEEIRALESETPVPKSSGILTLNPILNDVGLLVVGSRLQFLDADFEFTFPTILPKSSYLSKLIVMDVHQRVLHGGVNVTLATLPQRFWIPQVRQLVKAIISKCGVCKRLRGKAASQPFAPLPKCRLIASKPFETTGIDFAGPLYVKTTQSENNTTKAYVMLLTCSVVRAVHLELVPSLSTECCLLALRRFIARRGIPKLIISDNAKTFKRASLELRALGNIINSENLQGYAASHGISWQFIVERAPWWGGFWERLVRSVKEVLRVTIGRAVLSTEQLQTLLVEAESIINSRPLSYLSDDPLDLTPLTPSHFLIGAFPSVMSFAAPGCEVSEIRDKWRARFRLVSFFWKRWRTEYIQQLRSAHHMKRGYASSLKEGDVVLVHEQYTPRVLWKLALVEKTFPGSDGKVRSCEIRLHNGSRMRRPVQLLYPLEV